MKQFKKVYIEITNVCNLSCSFCPQTSRKPEFMQLETFSLILDQVRPHTNHIYLHVKGEPLLHPNIDQFLDLSYEKGFRVNITTNGTLIDKVKDKILGKPALRQINFSLHSFDGNEQPDSKEKYLKPIFNFIKESMDKSQVLISLRLWNHDNSSNKVPIDNKTDNQEILHAIEKEFNLPYKINDEVFPGRGIKIGERIYLNQDFEFKWPDLKEEEDDGIGFCYGLRNQIAILVDGTVVPCCLDGEGIIHLGNIKTTNFTYLLNSDRIQSIVDGFSNRVAVEELCRKCGYRKRFGKD